MVMKEIDFMTQDIGFVYYCNIYIRVCYLPNKAKVRAVIKLDATFSQYGPTTVC